MTTVVATDDPRELTLTIASDDKAMMIMTTLLFPFIGGVVESDLLMPLDHEMTTIRRLRSNDSVRRR
jgi:hypothetical protein